LSEQKAESEFWFLFDNYYAWEATSGIGEEIDIVRGFSDRRLLGTLSDESVLESELKKYLEIEGKDLKATIKSMLPDYLEMFRVHFGKDFEQKDVMSSLMWKSFRDFGLGVLYDPRGPRKPNKFIHVMDGGMQLYANWHRFNWIGSIVIRESPFSQPKLYIDRLVGLSAEIYSISRPCQTNREGKAPDNPPNGRNITNDQIESLTQIWSKLSFDEIENRMSQLADHDSTSSGAPGQFNPDCAKRFSGR